jgi:hypothetical protein
MQSDGPPGDGAEFGASLHPPQAPQDKALRCELFLHRQGFVSTYPGPVSGASIMVWPGAG